VVVWCCLVMFGLLLGGTTYWWLISNISWRSLYLGWWSLLTDEGFLKWGYPQIIQIRLFLVLKPLGIPQFFRSQKKCCHSWNALFNHQSSYDDPWRLHCFVDDLATSPIFLPQWPRFHAGDVLGMLYADGLPVGVLSFLGQGPLNRGW
jgi:hypothetical protein